MGTEKTELVKPKIFRINRKLNTLKRAEAVQKRYKELSEMRSEGMKVSSTAIMEKLQGEYFVDGQQIYLFLKMDIEAERRKILGVSES